MKLDLSTVLKSAAAAGALSIAGLALSTTAASAHYTTTRCFGDHCRVVRCDNDGDHCYTVREFHRGYWNNSYRDDDQRWQQYRWGDHDDAWWRENHPSYWRWHHNQYRDDDNWGW